MKINGIIAEYNPFHNGHSYQIAESARLTRADYTIVVMSGNYVQRGIPAICNKFIRAKAALLSGADLVLELPTLFATSSAEYFSLGGVSLLNQLNIVDHLCFGSECGDLESLNQIANILCEEPDAYKKLLQHHLKSGLSFPKSRALAIAEYQGLSSDVESLCSSPNNILGIEYLKALKKLASPIIPMTIRRQGSSYHDNTLDSEYSSASAIRSALLNDTSDKAILSLPQHCFPAEVTALYQKELAEGIFMQENHLSSILYYKLLSESDRGYEKYLDVSSALSDRILNKLNEFKSFSSFCDLLKTKELTYTRVSRCLLHILLNITKEELSEYSQNGYVPYARILGFRKESADILTAIKEHSAIPLISKLADAHTFLSSSAYALLQQDINSSMLYYKLSSDINEYTQPIIIV